MKHISKSLVCITLLVMTTLGINAQNKHTEVKESNYRHLQVSLYSDELNVQNLTIDGSTYSSLQMPGFVASSAVGQPALPTLVQMIETPLCDGFRINITSMVADTITAEALGLQFPVIPAQPSRSKSDTARHSLVIDPVAYGSDLFLGDVPIKVIPRGIARCQNIAALVFSPVRYNPVRGELIVLRSVEAEIVYVNPRMEKTKRMAALHSSGAYSPVPTINQPLEGNANTKELVNGVPVRYLIVAHNSFRGQLDGFIAWKKRKGFITDIVYTGDQSVGTTNTSIAAYVKRQYTEATASNPAPTFLLLVGDVEQIPAFDGRHTTAFDSHVTDLYYASWTDGDIIPDCYYGRFSAQNIDQLLPQIEKTLMYEQYTFADPSFLDRAVMVAGVDGGYQSDNAYTYGDPAMDYAISTYINGAAGFTQVTYYKNNTSNIPQGSNVNVIYNGGNNNTSQAQALRDLYSAGAGWINYTAHGGETEWSIPQFTTAQVASMNNSQKFGFMIGNCCLSNSFQVSECFGESLLRRADLCGAVAYIGGSNSTYWSEDFYWSVGIRSNISNSMNTAYNAANLGMYDCLVHSHGEPRSSHYTSAGAMIMAGNMAVENSTSDRKEYYWEIYHLMGDPSVIPWLTQADPGVLVVPSSITAGTTALTLQSSPYAYVALTDMNHEVVAAAFADAAGTATLRFEPLVPGNYELAATAQDRQPLFRSVTVAPPNGAYVVTLKAEPNRTCQVARHPEVLSGLLASADTAWLDITLANIGNAPSDSVVIALRSDPAAILPLAGCTVAPVAAGDTVTLSAALPVMVWNGLTDGLQTQLSCMARWHDAAGTQVESSSLHTLTVAAPKLTRQSYTPPAQPQPGASLQLSASYRNGGNQSLTPATASVVCPCPLVTVSNVNAPSAFAPGAALSVNFSAQLDNRLPQSILLPFYVTLSNGAYTFTDTLLLQIGTGATEDFESGDFTAYRWQNSTYGWQIISNSTDVYAGTYSARSYSFTSSSRNRNSELSISWTSSVDDSISYYRRVSSEESYDVFTLTMDNTTLETLSGEVAWSRAAFFVPAGSHTFKFKYSKDYTRSEGSDCAWIDNITFPVSGTAYRFYVDTVCQGEPYLLGGTDIAAGLQPGTYLFVDSSTRSVVNYLTLTVGSPISITLHTTADTIERGESVLLSASGANSYAWNEGYRVPTLMLYPERTATYTVTGTTLGCSDSKSVTVTVNGTVEAIQSVDASADDCLLYPNPAQSYVQITASADIKKVTIYDMQGRPLITKHDATRLDLQSLEKGIYIVTITTPSTTYTKKLIIN